MGKQFHRPRQGRSTTQPINPSPSTRKENGFRKTLHLIGNGLLLFVYLLLRLLSSRRVVPLLLLLVLCGIGLSSLPVALYELVHDLLHLPLSAAERQASTPVVIMVWWLGMMVILGLWLWRWYRSRNAPLSLVRATKWRRRVVVGFVVSLLLMAGIVYLESRPLAPDSSLQSVANGLFLPVGLALLFFGVAMLALLLEFLQARWGERAVERASQVSVLILGHGCALIFVVLILLAFYGILLDFPPQSVFEWFSFLALFGLLTGAPIFVLLRGALRWWRSSSRH